jgi:hypothetical protein
MKFIAKISQRVFGIELTCEIFVGGKSRGHKSATSNAQRSTSNAQFRANVGASPALNYRLSTINCGWRLHKLDGGAIWIANVNDALSGVGTGLKSLRFTGRFPAGRVDRAQEGVDIINDERHVHKALWPSGALTTASLSSAPSTPVISLAISPV